MFQAGVAFLAWVLPRFVTAYLEAMGEPAAGAAELDMLLLDCELAQLFSWHSGGRLAAWDERPVRP